MCPSDFKKLSPPHNLHNEIRHIGRIQNGSCCSSDTQSSKKRKCNESTILVGHQRVREHYERVSPRSNENRRYFRNRKEYRQCFEMLAHDATCRCIVVNANGKHFSVGLDLTSGGMMSGDGGGDEDRDAARKGFHLRSHILELQDTFTAMERCPQPVIVCTHGAVIGGAIDLCCAADIRMCTKDAWFCIKEVDIALAADVGTLQRLHHVMGNMSLARELAYTARRFESDEAKCAGFVSRVCESKGEMMRTALDMASKIASKSPIAIAGTKANLNYSRDHSIKDSLEYIATWNSVMLQTNDVMKAAVSSMKKGAGSTPKFSKL